MTSYNVDFDRRLLRQSEMDYGLHWAPCLMEAAQHQMGWSRWPKLSDAVDHYGVEAQQAHRALSDARMAAGVLVAMCQGRAASCAP